LTIEIEKVNIEALQKLKDSGVKVCPDPASLRIIQDKLEQKMFYKERGFETTEFYNANIPDLLKKIKSGDQSFPFVLKFRKDGYDGKGVMIIREEADLANLPDQDYLIEEFVDIQKEISVIAARNANGEIQCFDITEPVADSSGFLMTSLISPANISDDLTKKIGEVSKQLISELKIEGLLAIEFMIDQANNLTINEVSPRPHNTGHHTIEFNSVSQFEQHWRGVLNLPLTEVTSRNFAMCINVLGPKSGSGVPDYLGLNELLSEPDIHVHLYGKKESKPNRKLGHITVIADSREALEQKVSIVEKYFKVVV